MVDSERAFAPVEVFKLNRSYLSRAQAHVQQTTSHGVVTPSVGAEAIKDGEKSIDFFGHQMLGHAIQTPARYRWNGGNQMLCLVAATHCAKPQVAAQSAADYAHGARLVVLQRGYETHNVSRSSLTYDNRSASEQLSKK